MGSGHDLALEWLDDEFDYYGSMDAIDECSYVSDDEEEIEDAIDELDWIIEEWQDYISRLVPMRTNSVVFIRMAREYAREVVYHAQAARRELQTELAIVRARNVFTAF